MYSARDKKETGNMLVLWTLACFRTLRMRVGVRRLHECTEMVLLPYTRAENWSYQTVPRTPEIFTSLLHICDLRSRTTIEKLYI